MKLRNEVALVTGGGRGIGEAIALALAREGADVAVVSRTKSEIDSVTGRVFEMGRRALAIVGDVSQPGDVHEVVKITEQELGAIDILVNNAGISIPASVIETTTEDFDRVLDVNLKGTFLFTRAVLPGMIERNHGRIINISSRAGTEGHARYSAYCASKFGIIGFTQAVADEVKGSGITINVICPDEVDTPLNRRNHPDISDYSVWTTVDEIADVVVFFASAVSRAIQGATIEVYGHARR